jgi:hypothetical protein
MADARSPLKKTPMTRRTGERQPIALPADALAALEAAPGAWVAFERLSYTHQREHVEAILEAKKPETRARRIAKMIAMLSSDRPSLSNTVSTRPTLAKMKLGADERVLVLDADEAAMAIFAGREVSRRAGKQPFDVVVLYPADAAALAARLPAAMAACCDDGALWVAYPKQSSKRATTLTRDLGWEPTKRLELAPIAMIALDDVWAGVKFRVTKG